MGSSAPPAPDPPDYAAANREGILTDVETLPARRQIQAASRLGTAGTFMLDGKEYSYDFGGIGDADLNAAQLANDRTSAFAKAQDLLDIQSQYGQQFLETSRDQLKASDPIGFALREKLGQTITADLEAGRGLTADQNRTVTQATRGAQVARGNVSGVNAAVQEALNTSQYADQRYQQRLQNSAAFLSGTTPLSQFGQLRAAGAGAAPFQSMATTAIGLDPNAGNNAAQFALSRYGTQAQVYNTQMANQSNPWMEGLGMAAGLGGQLGSAKLLGCWVAREVYGVDNPKWLLFRVWMMDDAPEWFFNLYLKHGERFARWLRNKPLIKRFIRKWMDTKIEE